MIHFRSGICFLAKASSSKLTGSSNSSSFADCCFGSETNESEELEKENTSTNDESGGFLLFPEPCPAF